MRIADMSAELIDVMGTDLTVVRSARVSFAKESGWEERELTEEERCSGDLEEGWRSGWEECSTSMPEREIAFRLPKADEKLINYLAKHNHWTTFGHCFATFRIKAPIFVARQMVKHQVGLVWNEESRRYIDEEPEFWIPKEIRERPDGSVKQGSGGLHPNQGYNSLIESSSASALAIYEDMIQDKVAPEMARMVLPLNTMTNWIWSGSLAAWARVANLRLDPHAQKEAQDLVKLIAAPLSDVWPVSWKALVTNKQGE